MAEYCYKKIRLNKQKVKDEHRVVMERHLKRTLSFNEVVHHKDRNKRNNKIENLEVLSRSEHTKHHVKNGEVLINRRISNDGKIKLCKLNSSVNETIARRIKFKNEKCSDLIKEFNISKSTISRIRTGKSWKHLQE